MGAIRLEQVTKRFESAVVIPRVEGTLRLYHAIDGIPIVVAEPFVEFQRESGVGSRELGAADA